MIPDIYTREKIAFKHRHTLLREAERERIYAYYLVSLLCVATEFLQQEQV